MVDQLVGLLLLGLGVNKSFYGPYPTVKGDSTVATAPGEPEDREVPNKNLGILRMQANFTHRVEASRDAAKREFEVHRTTLQGQLPRLKDTRKQAVVEKLQTNCQNINIKRTDKMTGMIAKMSSILTNVENRAASASAAGKNIASVSAAIGKAQTAIADAQEAVTSQSGAVCTITVTSETNVKTDVGNVISGLQSDLKSVYAKVIAARKSVSDAIRALALVMGEKL